MSKTQSPRHLEAQPHHIAISPELAARLQWAADFLEKDAAELAEVELTAQCEQFEDLNNGWLLEFAHEFQYPDDATEARVMARITQAAREAGATWTDPPEPMPGNVTAFHPPPAFLKPCPAQGDTPAPGKVVTMPDAAPGLE